MASSLTLLSKIQRLKRLQAQAAEHRRATAPIPRSSSTEPAHEKPAEGETEAEKITRWRRDPVAFARERLGIEPWEKPCEILRALRDHDRIAVRSGHKVAKSNTGTIAAYWFVNVHEDSRVVLTSSSGPNVKNVIWREIRAVWRKAPDKPSPEPPKLPSTGIEWADGRQIVGFTTDESERIAGISGKNVLFTLDEASGIAEDIFEAIEGNRAGGAKILMLGNPTQVSGEFHEAFHSKREFYRTFQISSWETPNARTGQIVIPGLATRAWCEEKRREWGEDSPLYQVRVLGNPPRQAANSVIGLALVEAAIRRFESGEVEPGPILDIGVDVARYGDDDSVIRGVWGKLAGPQEVIQSADGPQVAEAVVEFLRKHRIPGQRVRIKVDVIGFGASCYDHLIFLKNENPDSWVGVSILGVNVAESATSEEDALLRDQLWFACREWLESGGAFESESKLESELVTPKYSLTAKGKRKVEPKEKIKERLKRSPDRADALNLAIYEGGAEVAVTQDFEPLSRWAESPGRGF